MHVSSPSPRGRTPGQPGEFIKEKNEMDWIVFPWEGENSCYCFRFEEKGWGNSKFCKIADSKVHRDPTVIYLHKYREGKLHGFERPEDVFLEDWEWTSAYRAIMEMYIERWLGLQKIAISITIIIPLLLVGHSSHPLLKLVISHGLCTDIPSPSEKIGRGDVCESLTIIVFWYTFA